MAATQDLRTEFLICVRNCEFPQLFTRCSEVEMLPPSGVVLDPWFYLHFFFSCLFTNSLTQAKFLWKRLPAEFKTEPELAAVWGVCKSLIKRKYSEVFRLLDAGRWRVGEDMSRLFRAQFAERMTNLMMKAYSSIRIGQAANMLGMLPADMANFAATRNWTITGDVIHPKPSESQSDRAVHAEEIERVTRMLNFLEQKEHAF